MTLTVSRLAPTPNGELHWGNLLNFAATWAMVRREGGKLWLRFDDMDADRCEERFAGNTREVLRYLGLHWDEEYSHQRDQLAQYREFLQQIPHYICDCSRQEVQLRTGDHHYDGHCRNRKLMYRPGMSAIRFLNPLGPVGDFVLWRREDIPSYHLTCVADELRLGINLVIRGEDLCESTNVQFAISKTLPGDPLSKIRYLHHPLILGDTGEKLSKSRGDGDLTVLVKKKIPAEDFWRELGRRAGRELRSPEDTLLLL